MSAGRTDLKVCVPFARVKTASRKRQPERSRGIPRYYLKAFATGPLDVARDDDRSMKIFPARRRTC